MEATIYALVDPNTHQVRYVGRTNQTAQRRYQLHMNAARRGVWNTAQAAETKWMKRFERSQLLCDVPRDSRTYKSLTNPA